MMTMLLVGNCPTATLASDHPSVQNIDDLVPEIEQYTRQTMEAWNVPGTAIAIVQGDKQTYAKGFGRRAKDNAKSVTADTVFQIGSTTKAFLGVTLAQLAAQGKLDWQDRVIDHYPRFRLADPWVTNEFRIADLLSQRSGLPAFALTEMMFYGYDAQDVIQALQHVRPVSSFRSQFAYQNAFHLIAEQIVAEKHNATDWANVLQKTVLDPLDMANTTITAKALQDNGNHASGHRYEDGRLHQIPTAPMPYNAGGAGALNSSVNDMSHWLRMQMNEGQFRGRQILPATDLAQTHEQRISLDSESHNLYKMTHPEQTGYATGWMVHYSAHGRSINHAGGTVGYNTFVGFDPDRQIGVVVLTNATDNYSGGMAVPLGYYLLERLRQHDAPDYAAQWLSNRQAAEQAQQDHDRLPADAEPHRPLDQYAGHYVSSTLGAVDLVINDEALQFEVGPHHMEVHLQPWSGNTFITEAHIPAYGDNPATDRKRLWFQENERNEITGFKWEGDSASSNEFKRIDD